MNKRTLILMAIGLLVIVPIVLNFFVRINSCIPTIGDERDWLAFFGSYWGGIFSCIVAFIAVYQQFRQGVLDTKIRNQEQKIEHLRTDLANCIGSFNFAQIGAISLFMEETVVYDHIDTELAKLNEAHIKASMQANVWGLVYGQAKEKHIETFNELYQNCIEKFQKDINTMTRLLYNLKHKKEYNRLHHRINCVIKILNEHEKTLRKPLFDTAQHVIDQEREALSQLQNERKRFKITCRNSTKAV